MASDHWKSLTMKIIALGHTLRDAQQMAAVILIARLFVDSHEDRKQWLIHER